MSKYFTKLAIVLSVLTPVITFAQDASDPGPMLPLFRVIWTLGRIVGSLVPIAIAIALLLFIWGLIKYMRSDSDEKKGEARSYMMSGVIVLTVMVFVWGIVNILISTFGIVNPEEAPSPRIDLETRAHEAAPAPASIDDVGDIANVINVTLSKIIPVIMLLALLVFLWGIAKYVTTSNETTRKESIQVMVYGVIILVVMTSVWGLVYVLANTFNIEIGDGSQGSILLQEKDVTDIVKSFDRSDFIKNNN